MQISRLWVQDFRNYNFVELTTPPGITAVLGNNGQGKTNLLEAFAYLATLESFRWAPKEALVRDGALVAVLRAEGDEAGRGLLVEAELSPSGRDRVQVNRQPLKRSKDILGRLRVTVFSPDDLELVKGPPWARRRLMDDILASLHSRHDQARTELERVLRQRASLLKQAGVKTTPDILGTLDVWDGRLATVGTSVAEAREELVKEVAPLVARAYVRLSGMTGQVEVVYRRSWQGDLAAALMGTREEDLRRGSTTIGPHRDELVIRLAGLPARGYASQGEHRSLALALRLATHELVTQKTGVCPLLLLDDVFSELDGERAASLLQSLPHGQTVMTTAGTLPPGVWPEKVVRVSEGRLES